MSASVTANSHASAHETLGRARALRASQMASPTPNAAEAKLASLSLASGLTKAQRTTIAAPAATALVNLGSAASSSVKANASAVSPVRTVRPVRRIAGAPGAARYRRRAIDAISVRPASAAKLRLADRCGRERDRGTTAVTHNNLTRR